MSKPAVGIAVLVLATLLSSVALGKGGGGHGGGHGSGHGHGGGHFHGGGHHGLRGAHFGGGRHMRGRSAISRSASMQSAGGRNARNSLSRAGALRYARTLGNPAARARNAAGAANSGLANCRGASGWWQH